MPNPLPLAWMNPQIRGHLVEFALAQNCRRVRPPAATALRGTVEALQTPPVGLAEASRATVIPTGMPRVRVIRSSTERVFRWFGVRGQAQHSMSC